MKITGWLSSFPVFEPHWQVTIADALATGSVIWNGTKYAFENQPFYAEKNWGDALPSKWYWTQCNSFDNNEDELSVTGGGGIRKLPFGREEELGMIAVHYKGRSVFVLIDGCRFLVLFLLAFDCSHLLLSYLPPLLQIL